MNESKIEWTDGTFNPWRGCAKVSPGCANCYAENLSGRWGSGQFGEWGPNGTRIVASESAWREPLKLAEAAREGRFQGCRECGFRGVFKTAICPGCNKLPRWSQPVRPRIFCASLADVFEDYKGGKVLLSEKCAECGGKGWSGFSEECWADLTPVRARLFDLIRQTPEIDWLVLTKRPEGVVARILEVIDWNASSDLNIWLNNWLNNSPRENVWLGTSAEDQERWDDRVPKLLEIPAKIHFVSVEPMLGPVDIRSSVPMNPPNLRLPDWIICGGESGPGAREMKQAWAVNLQHQCHQHGIPFLFKQWGEWNGAAERVGKKKAGRTLLGKTYDEYPA